MTNYDFASLYPQTQVVTPTTESLLKELLQKRINDKRMKSRLDKLEVLIGENDHSSN